MIDAPALGAAAAAAGSTSRTNPQASAARVPQPLSALHPFTSNSLVIAEAGPGSDAQAASKTVARPWPTPTQRVATPYLPPRRRSSRTRVPARRAPEQPSGGAGAVAPPLTLRQGSSIPSPPGPAGGRGGEGPFSPTRGTLSSL